MLKNLAFNPKTQLQIDSSQGTDLVTRGLAIPGDRSGFYMITDLGLRSYQASNQPYDGN